MSDLASLLGLRRAAPPEVVEAPEAAFARGLAQGRQDGALALEAAEAAHREARETDALAFAAAVAQLEQELADAMLPLLRETLERLMDSAPLADSALAAAARALALSMPLASLHAHPAKAALLAAALGPDREVIADVGIAEDMVEARLDQAAVVAGVGLRLAALLAGPEQNP